MDRGPDFRAAVSCGLATLSNHIAYFGRGHYASLMRAYEFHEDVDSSGVVPGPSAEAFDPVLEAFRRDIDFSLVERNLRLSTEERAQQLVNATRFIRRFRPLVSGPER